MSHKDAGVFRPGPIAVLAAKSAVANVGVLEEGFNAGEAVETYQASTLPPAGVGAPWCACFVAYRLRTAAAQVGSPIPLSFPLTAWTPDYKRWAYSNNLWLPIESVKREYLAPEIGDLACFYFSAVGRIAHIGIVTSVRGGSCITVEGNTGPDKGKMANRDGDGVYLRTRNWQALGSGGGFVRLPF